MELLHIGCETHLFICIDYKASRNKKTVTIHYDEEYIKNVINSNHYTYIEACGHKKNELQNFLSELGLGSSSRIPSLSKSMTQWNKNDNHYCCEIYNLEYDKLYGIFEAKKDSDEKSIVFQEIGTYADNRYKIISVEKFITQIKKGTLIKVKYNTVLASEITKILFEHSTGFVLELLFSERYTIYRIDTHTFTKPAKLS